PGHRGHSLARLERLPHPFRGAQGDLVRLDPERGPGGDPDQAGRLSMPEGLAQLAARLFAESPEDEIRGVALAVVLDNVDLEGEGRVQLRLPWLPGFEPWAR